MPTNGSTEMARPAAAGEPQAVVERLRTWDDAAVHYQVRLVLDRVARDSDEMQARAEEVRVDPDCKAVIEGSFLIHGIPTASGRARTVPRPVGRERAPWWRSSSERGPGDRVWVDPVS